jgi:hypothetical protein
MRQVLKLGTLLMVAVAVGAMVSTAAAEEDSVADALHAKIDNMSAEQQAALLVLLETLSGDKGAVSALSDEEQIEALLEEWKEAILAKDVDTFMAAHSEDFAHDGYEYAADSKAELKEFIEGSIEQGGWDDVEISMDDADLVIEDGEATIYPIDYTNWEGHITIELVLAKEESAWLITDMYIEGL